MVSSLNCILCDHASLKAIETPSDQRAYLHCPNCDLLFLNPVQRLEGGEERSRYQLHQTKSSDEGYQEFVRPLLERLITLKPEGSQGLDFGAGHQPVFSQYLKESGFEVTCYDPFFWPNEEALKTTYDFIVAVEVVEHFFSPRDEFSRLRGLLHQTGCLLINTEVYRHEIDFDKWYYRRDPTHVAFYSKQTFAWIAEHWAFSRLTIQNRVVCFELDVVEQGESL